MRQNRGLSFMLGVTTGLGLQAAESGAGESLIGLMNLAVTLVQWIV
jgi:hypothetical protein